MLRLFLDTNILVSATFWRGNSYRIILKIIDGRATGFTTSHVLQEYRTVLKRDFGLSEGEADARVEKLLEFLEVVSHPRTLDIVKEDASDNRVLEGALAAGADFLLSYDNHLLALRTLGSIRITKPEELLGDL